MEYTIRIGFKVSINEAKCGALLADLRVAIELEMELLDAYSDF